MKNLFIFLFIWLSLTTNAQFPAFEPVDSGNIKEIITKEKNWEAISAYTSKGLLQQETNYREKIVASEFFYKQWQKGNNQYMLTTSSFPMISEKLNYELEERIFENQELIKINSWTYSSTDTTKKSLTVYDNFVYKNSLLQSYKEYSVKKGIRKLECFYTMHYNLKGQLYQFYVSEMTKKNNSYSSKINEELVPVGLYTYYYNEEDKIERIKFEEPSLTTIGARDKFFSIDYFEYDKNGNWIKNYGRNYHNNKKELIVSRKIIYR